MVYIYMCRACLILQCRSAFEQSSVRIWLRRKIIPYSVNLYTVQCTVYTVITTYSRVDLSYLCTVKYQVKEDKRREVTSDYLYTVRNACSSVVLSQVCTVKNQERRLRGEKSLVLIGALLEIEVGAAVHC